MIKFLIVLNNAILIYFFISAFFYTILLVGSFITVINYFNRESRVDINKLLLSKSLPPVTVLIPMFNEQENIVNVVESSLKSTYKNIFITVINDASTDNSLSILIDRYQLFEVPVIIEQQIKTSAVKTVYISKNQNNLMVIDKVKNTGTGDSINIGVNASFTPYFITIDADSMISPTAVAEFIFDIMTVPNAIIVGGGVYVLNGCKYHDGVMIQSRLPKKTVPAIQSVEYIRAHLFGRAGWNAFGGTMSYPGTATLFDRKIVIAVGGFDTHNFAQDAEIIMRIHAHMHKHKLPYRILFNPAVAVWTEVPNHFIAYARQRDRWRRGLLRSTLSYWYMFFNPKYGIQGLIGYPMYVLLEILGPLVEFLAYLCVALAFYFGVFSPRITLLYIFLAWGFISYVTIGNMFINLITFNRYKRVRDIFRIFFLTVLETFGFRQYGVAINLFGTFHYLINRLRGKLI